MKCTDCSMELQQKAVKAIGNGEVQMVWVIVGTSQWVCDQTGDEHRAVEGAGQGYYEVEFTKVVHVIADNPEHAYEQAETEVLDHVRSTGVIDWSNYDDAVRRISKEQY